MASTILLPCFHLRALAVRGLTGQDNMADLERRKKEGKERKGKEKQSSCQ